MPSYAASTQVNGVITANNVILENTCDRNIPAYVEGQLMLIGEDTPVEYREMYIRELASTPKFKLSSEEKKEGFEILFDGTSISIHLMQGILLVWQE